MKYFNITSLQATIVRIREGNITHEHRTGTAATGLIRNYFPIEKFAVTPEQIQEFTKKKPDLAIEKFIPHNSYFVHLCFVELKSIVNSSINNIPNQLFNTLYVAIDDYGSLSDNFSVFMLDMKGTKVAFYVYHSFGPLLDDYDINNYKGFMPLNYLIPESQFLDFWGYFPLAEQTYELYMRRLEFETDPTKLRDLGALETEKFKHPHVLDLLNEKHRDHIHNMFKYFAEQDPNQIFKT